MLGPEESLCLLLYHRCCRSFPPRSPLHRLPKLLASNSTFPGRVRGMLTKGSLTEAAPAPFHRKTGLTPHYGHSYIHQSLAWCLFLAFFPSGEGLPVDWEMKPIPTD